MDTSVRIRTFSVCNAVQQSHLKTLNNNTIHKTAHALYINEQPNHNE
jgi:hypothetical protein